MGYLLDVNVLIALIDRNHVHHARAMKWFMTSAEPDWLSCPTSRNGLIRIMSGSRYGPTSFDPGAVVGRLHLLLETTGHRFVADDVSLLDDTRITHAELTSSGQVTDTYLLALAVTNQAWLATMDHCLRPAAVIGGREHLHHIP